MLTVDTQPSPAGAGCQAPVGGKLREPVETLLVELRRIEREENLQAAGEVLADRVIGAIQHLRGAGMHALHLACIAQGQSGLLMATRALAELAPTHSPFDADEALRADAEAMDQCAALGLLLRRVPETGKALDLLCVGYCDALDDTWRARHHARAAMAAQELLIHLRPGSKHGR